MKTPSSDQTLFDICQRSKINIHSVESVSSLESACNRPQRSSKCGFLFFLALLFAGQPGSTSAEIVSVSGDMLDVTATLCSLGPCSSSPCSSCSVESDCIESDTHAHVFQEQIEETLTADVDVDVTVPGTYGTTLSPGTIPAGTKINSYYISGDSCESTSVRLSGSVVFEERIIGVIVSDALLDDSDSLLGRSGVDYPTGLYQRGLELTTDEIVVTDYDLSTGDLRVAAVVDQIRVLTEPLDRHFLVYSIQPHAQNERLSLRGQFETSGGFVRARVMRMANIANPVEKRHGGDTYAIPDNNEHFTIYDLRQPTVEPARTVVLENQFGTQTWTIGDTKFLFAPATKQGHADPEYLDHYKCYDVTKGTAPGVVMDLSDQFGSITMIRVDTPKLFCVPVDKRHNKSQVDIIDESSHLAVYEIDHVDVPDRNVWFTDQFRTERGVHVMEATGLVVESTKTSWK